MTDDQDPMLTALDEISAVVGHDWLRGPSEAERQTARAIVADRLGVMPGQASAIVDNLDTSRGASLCRLARLLTTEQLDQLGRST